MEKNLCISAKVSLTDLHFYYLTVLPPDLFWVLAPFFLLFFLNIDQTLKSDILLTHIVLRGAENIFYHLMAPGDKQDATLKQKG